jgi:hypothetical protein
MNRQCCCVAVGGTGSVLAVLFVGTLCSRHCQHPFHWKLELRENRQGFRARALLGKPAVAPGDQVKEYEYE